VLVCRHSSWLMDGIGGSLLFVGGGGHSLQVVVMGAHCRSGDCGGGHSLSFKGGCCGWSSSFVGGDCGWWQLFSGWAVSFVTSHGWWQLWWAVGCV
jgi:hypothetical protein